MATEVSAKRWLDYTAWEAMLRDDQYESLEQAWKNIPFKPSHIHDSESIWFVILKSVTFCVPPSFTGDKSSSDHHETAVKWFPISGFRPEYNVFSSRSSLDCLPPAFTQLLSTLVDFRRKLRECQRNFQKNSKPDETAFWPVFVEPRKMMMERQNDANAIGEVRQAAWVDRSQSMLQRLKVQVL
jgi:hypothetical protein